MPSDGEVEPALASAGLVEDKNRESLGGDDESLISWAEQAAAAFQRGTGCLLEAATSTPAPAQWWPVV